MSLHMIICPYCQGKSPVDARFCIECSAALQQAATNTTQRLVHLPDPIASRRGMTRRHAISIGHIVAGITGTLLVSTLLLLGVLADHNLQLDSVARLILIVGGLQFVRCTLRGKIVAGLRAAVICLALVLAMVTPWMLTVSVAATPILVSLHLIETHRGLHGSPLG